MIRLLIALSLLVQGHGTEPVLEPAMPAAMQLIATAAAVETAAQSPVHEANVAAKAANAAATAANAAAAAANTAANAAVSANVAANAAATANSAAASASSPAQNQAAATNAQNAAASAASTAANAAASANLAINAAAQANTAAAKAANAAETASSSVAAPAVNAMPAVVAIPGRVAGPAAAAVNALAPPSHVWSPTHVWSMPSLLAGLSFAMFVKALCVAGNVLVQVSPLPSVRRWEARGCTGEADAAPYVSIAFGGCQWCFYGIFAWLVTSRSGFLILVHSNVLGAVLGTYYVSAFFRNCRDDEALRSLQKYISAVTALALLQVCALSTLPAERALFLIGIISSFCSFINATSVLVTVPQVVRTKNSRSIPGPYAVANLLSSMVWSLCGWILADPCVMMPNMFSTLCAAASLGVKAFYPSKDDDCLLSTVEEGVKKDTPMKPLTYAAKKALAAIPKEFTPMKPSAAKVIAGTFPENVQKIPPDVPESAAFSTDGGCSGGTGGC